MQFSQPSANVLIPDGASMPHALSRVTHLGVGAHQDDLEFMAFHGIAACFHSREDWFGGVTCTNGAGSSRIGPYAGHTDADMMAVRRTEQELAARVGRYGWMAQLDHPSSVVKSPDDSRLRDDLRSILSLCRPRLVYTHNPADKHDTHLGVTVALLEAIRSLPPDQRPQAVHGCEVWRNLDWMEDADKVVHNVSGNDCLAAGLNSLFDSQIAGGKRYDLAVMGRRRANATFFDSHSTDDSDSLAFAMDLTPLIQDDSLDILDFTLSHVEKFAASIREKLGRRLGR
ncbi:MAG: PIG-L family deacetylase [Verrucomicrobiaceae bacterium]|nr:MAG: PIG-L family deacetylase [Verrucomicrobiaceae bacterium]